MFTPDVEIVLQTTTSLVNTLPALSGSGEDELDRVAALDAILEDSRDRGRRDRTRAELGEVQVLREHLLRYWGVSRDGAVDIINADLRETNATPQLARHDDLDWHIHAQPAETSLAARLRTEAAMAFLDLVRDDEWSRVKRCEAPGCEAVLIDLSRNRSKRYCDTGNCGNRVNVEAYRQRLAEAQAGEE